MKETIAHLVCSTAELRNDQLHYPTAKGSCIKAAKNALLTLIWSLDTAFLCPLEPGQSWVTPP